MNSFSHNIVCKLIHTYLEVNYGITLRKTSFRFGNLLPDFSLRYKKMPHEPEYWEKHLKEEIKELAGHLHPQMQMSHGDSKRLGVICHFFADFFCYAHTASYSGGTYPHFMYEWALYRYMRKNLERLCATDIDINVMKPTVDTLDIYACFDQLYKDYLKQQPALIHDVLYTLNACAETLAQMVVAGTTVPAGRQLATAEA